MTKKQLTVSGNIGIRTTTPKHKIDMYCVCGRHVFTDKKQEEMTLICPSCRNFVMISKEGITLSGGFTTDGNPAIWNKVVS